MSRQKATRKEKFSTKPADKPDSPKSKQSSDRLYRWLGIIVALSGFILYANTLGHGYTMDDYSSILENKSTKKGFDGIGEIFKTSYRYGYIFVSDELYRPVSKSILAIQWGISPNNPTIGHWINVLLFALTGWLLFKSLNEWLKGNVWVAFASAMIFMAHPIHTEVVANIKSIDEILAFLFGIMMLRAVYKYATTEKTSSLIKSGVWFLLALFSKESAITFLAIVPLMYAFFIDKSFKKSWIPTSVCLLTALIFLAIRTKVIGQGAISLNPSIVDNMLMAAPDFSTRFATTIYLLGLYLKTLLLPFNLTFDNSYPQLPIVGIGSWQFILSALILIGMLVYAIIGFKRRDTISFALLFFFITISISSNLVVIIGTHYGERLMYTPGFGICLLFAILLKRYLPENILDTKKSFIAQNKNAFIVLSIIFLLYGGITIARNPVWKDNGTLYVSGLSSAPRSCRTQYYMGNYLIKEDVLNGKSPKEQDSILYAGIGYLKEAVRLNSSFADAWNQMGIAYSRLKKPELAINSYYEGLKINPNDPTISNNLGTVLFTSGKYREALISFRQAVKINPRYAEAWTNIGCTYGATQQFDDAIQNFEKAIVIDPNYAPAYNFLGITWQNKGNSVIAQRYFDKAYSLDPNLRK